MSTYRCEYCRATFEHPGSEECETVRTHCAHLMNAGWRPVWVRVSLQGPEGEQDRHIFSKGGWICVQCAKTFLGTRPLRPKERHLDRGRHQEVRTR